MAFYKARLQKKSNLYYPEAVMVGKKVATKQLATMLSDRCTVTLADTMAVLSELGMVMSSYMSQGKSVHLDGIGSFRYTINATKQGVETEKEVSVKQIRGIRVRFVPEVTRNMDKSVATRSMQPNAVDWIEWGKTPEETDADDTNEEDKENGNDSTDTGSGESNPL